MANYTYFRAVLLNPATKGLSLIQACNRQVTCKVSVNANLKTCSEAELGHCLRVNCWKSKRLKHRVQQAYLHTSLGGYKQAKTRGWNELRNRHLQVWHCAWNFAGMQSFFLPHLTEGSGMKDWEKIRQNLNLRSWRWSLSAGERTTFSQWTWVKLARALALVSGAKVSSRCWDWSFVHVDRERVVAKQHVNNTLTERPDLGE